MRILAVDPGPTESGWCIIDADTYRPVGFGKDPNDDVLDIIDSTSYSHLAIEMIASYGMPVGREVFQTCLWVGRFVQQHEYFGSPGCTHSLVYRRDIKHHLCHSAKATDATVRQALVDRFACGVRNHGKGVKAEPGFFYGFHRDIWQAHAIAVYVADRLEATSPQVAS